MSVDAGGGKLKWPKAIKKVNKQAHNFFLIKEMYIGMTYWLKKIWGQG